MSTTDLHDNKTILPIFLIIISTIFNGLFIINSLVTKLLIDILTFLYYLYIQRQVFMNGVVFDLKRFATHDGPGIRTSVFLKGCPLNCLWCHNPESINPLPETITLLDKKKCLNLSSSKTIHSVGKEITADLLFSELVKDKIFFDESNGGLTFTGGEPLFQPDFLLHLLKLAKHHAIHTAVDTSGFADYSVFKSINPFTDLYLFDLKLMNPDLHHKYTGVSNSIILDNLANLNTDQKSVILRIPLIPDITDTFENISEIADFSSHLNNVISVSLLPFNPLYQSKCRRFNLKTSLSNITKQSDSHLQNLKKILEASNLTVNIGG